MNLIIVPLTILVAAMITFYILKVLALPPDIHRIAHIVAAAIFLIAIFMVLLPLVGVPVPMFGGGTAGSP